jgi:hypothetical protein
MIPLKEPLAKQVEALRGRPRAALIDDELSAKDEPRLDKWMNVRELMQTDGEFYAKLLQGFEQAGLSPEVAPSGGVLKGLAKAAGEPRDQNVQKAISEYGQQQHVLQKFQTFLQEIGFQLDLFPNRPTELNLLEYDLFLVDFQLEGGEEAGETAVKLFRDLMEISSSKQKTPPMVILMSKAISADDVKKWESVAHDSGYFRFNYDFISKTDFDQDQSVLSLLLFNLLEHKPVADLYFKLIRGLLEETHLVSRLVAKDLFQVTPSEAQIFNKRIKAEGDKLSEVFTQLFAKLLQRGISASAALRDTMQELDKAVEPGLLVPTKGHRDTLHRLYSRLLYASCDGGDPRPQFGDVYKDETEKWFLVVSQDCDLILRGEKGAKVERVLAVEGALFDRDLLPGDPDSIISKPIRQGDEDAPQWVWWNLRKPAVIEYAEITKAPYVKRFRLRFEEAESIQNEFASSLTRVALDLMPNYVSRRECRLFSERQNGFLGSGVALYQAVHGETTLMALAPDYKGLFFALQYPFITLEKLLKFGRFMPEAEFLRELSQEKIFIFEEGDSLVMFKSKTGNPPLGKKLWGAKDPKTGKPKEAERAVASEE